MMMLRSSAVVFELLLFLAATLCPHPAKAFVGTGTAAPNRGWVGSSHSEKKRVASQGVGFGSGRPFDIGAISPLPSAPSTRDLAQALRGSEEACDMGGSNADIVKGRLEEAVVPVEKGEPGEIDLAMTVHVEEEGKEKGGERDGEEEGGGQLEEVEEERGKEGGGLSAGCPGQLALHNTARTASPSAAADAAPAAPATSATSAATGFTAAGSAAAAIAAPAAAPAAAGDACAASAPAGSAAAAATTPAATHAAATAAVDPVAPTSLPIVGLVWPPSGLAVTTTELTAKIEMTEVADNTDATAPGVRADPTAGKGREIQVRLRSGKVVSFTTTTSITGGGGGGIGGIGGHGQDWSTAGIEARKRDAAARSKWQLGSNKGEEQNDIEQVEGGKVAPKSKAKGLFERWWGGVMRNLPPVDDF